MGGVTGEEHPALPPLLGDEGVESVAGGAPEVAIRGGEPAGEELPDGLGLLHGAGVFVGEEHDLPAAMVAGSDDVRAGAGGFAELGGGGGEFREAMGVHADVDDEPGFVEDQVLPGDAELLADLAGSAVGADEVFGLDDAGFELDGYAFGVLFERDEVLTEGDVDSGV